MGPPRLFLTGALGLTPTGANAAQRKIPGFPLQGMHLARILQTLLSVYYVPARISNVGDEDRNAVQLTPFVSCHYSVCGYGATSYSLTWVKPLPQEPFMFSASLRYN